MSIKKQEFYEGAALHLLSRSGRIDSLIYKPPFFFLNSNIRVLLKYSTKGRSQWGFTFTADEQRLLQQTANLETVIGLICGADGVAAFRYPDYCQIAHAAASAIHLACYRKHGEHYEVIGPDGSMRRKIPPSSWQRILDS